MVGRVRSGRRGSHAAYVQLWGILFVISASSQSIQTSQRYQNDLNYQLPLEIPVIYKDGPYLAWVDVCACPPPLWEAAGLLCCGNQTFLLISGSHGNACVCVRRVRTRMRVLVCPHDALPHAFWTSQSSKPQGINAIELCVTVPPSGDNTNYNTFTAYKHQLSEYGRCEDHWLCFSMVMLKHINWNCVLQVLHLAQDSGLKGEKGDPVRENLHVVY